MHKTYLDNVCPDNLVIAFSHFGDKPVPDLLTIIDRSYIVALKKPREKLVNGINVLYLHLPPAPGRRVIWQGILVNLILRLTAHRQVAEADLVQLLPVEGPVIVAARTHRLRQDNRGRIDSLPDLLPVAQPGDGDTGAISDRCPERPRSSNPDCLYT